jgi:superfamily II DNA or RNA helicase
MNRTNYLHILRKQHTNHMKDDIFKCILQDKQFHLQLKSEQKEIIQNVLERKDSMAVLPTGFGKSMCYILPPFSRKLRLPQCIMGYDLHINKQTNIFIANHRHLLRQNN